METIPVDSELKRGRNKMAVAIVVSHAIKHMYISGQSALIMPEIKLSLGLTRAQFGSLSTANAVAWWVSTMVAGYLGDRFSHRAGLMLAISLALMGGSLFLAGYAPNYVTMLAIMFLVGIGPSMFHPPAIGELSRRFPDRRGFVVSLHGMAASVGQVLGAPTVAIFLVFVMWRTLLKASIGPALAVAFVVWLMMPSREGEREAGVVFRPRYFSSLIGLLSNRVLLVLIVATALRSIGEGGVGFLPLYLRDDLAYPVTTVAIILSLGQVGGIISQPIMGYVSDRVGRKPVLVVGTALVMLSAFALSVAKPGIQLFLAILLRGSFSFSLHHIFVAAALDAAGGKAHSTVVSLIYGASFLGSLSPYIAGLISDRYGIQSAFVYGGAVMILPTILLIVTRLHSLPPAFERESEKLRPLPSK